MSPRLEGPVLDGTMVRLEPLHHGHAADLAVAAEEDRSSYAFTWRSSRLPRRSGRNAGRGWKHGWPASWSAAASPGDASPGDASASPARPGPVRPYSSPTTNW